LTPYVLSIRALSPNVLKDICLIARRLKCEQAGAGSYCGPTEPPCAGLALLLQTNANLRVEEIPTPRWTRDEYGIQFQRLLTELLQRVPLFRGKSGLLSFSDFFCCALRQLSRAGFTNKHGDFVVRWLATTFHSELLDCGVTLRTPYAVLFKLVKDSARHDILEVG
jgi:hypothetical protein